MLQSRSAYIGRRKVFELPERGPRDCFPEQKAGRARREYSTECSSQTQKTRCTTACCWAMETSTTGVKVMKRLTRACADFAELKRRRCEGHRRVRIELALKLTFFGPFVYRRRIPLFQGGEMGSIPIRATDNLMNQNVAKAGIAPGRGPGDRRFKSCRSD